MIMGSRFDLDRQQLPNDFNAAHRPAPPRIPESGTRSAGDVDAPRAGAIRLGRIGGVELDADWSVAIIFFLVAFGLGAGMLPRWHPDWSFALRWAVAIAAALAFFASILVHELSHALVGRARGLSIPRITLFVFGGAAHLQGDPKTPKDELLMAAVGPATSLVIGIAATMVGAALVSTNAVTDAEDVARMAGPIATILLWLGPINVLLAIFNLVPGFPLDGGRVLRAVFWWSTGDLEKATRWASGIGRAFGGLLIASGLLMVFGFVVPVLGSGLGRGIWTALIGWFLHNAARASYVELRLRRRLDRVRVRDVMRADVDAVAPDLPIGAFVSDHVMSSDQTSFPVIREGVLVGVVTARAVRRVPFEEWQRVVVADIMTPSTDVESVDADAKASLALEVLTKTNAEQLPVVNREGLLGFVRMKDIVKWLSLQPDAVR